MMKKECLQYYYFQVQAVITYSSFVCGLDSMQVWLLVRVTERGGFSISFLRGNIMSLNMHIERMDRTLVKVCLLCELSVVRFLMMQPPYRGS